jgi:hypothetical protein
MWKLFIGNASASRSQRKNLKREQKEVNIMQYEDIPTTCNEHYDLISVLYHMLEGAWKYETYYKDAEKAGDHALAQFFREAQLEECKRAERAKELLRQRLALVSTPLSSASH